MHERGRGDAGRDLDAFHEPVLAVEAQHPEVLDCESCREGLAVRRHKIGAVEQRSFTGLLAKNTSRHFHHRQERQRLHAADAFQFAKILRAPPD